MQINEVPAGQVRCLRCGRILRAASSRQASYGAWCRAKIRAAALAEAVKGFTSDQIAKAQELITDGGLVPAGRPGVFRAMSSRGDATYLVSKDADNCPASRRGKACACYHVAAVRILTAGRTA